jgi:signal transduction histidine kinase
LWLDDVHQESNFPRRELAIAAGLRTAFCFPIRDGDRMLGVIEFLDAQRRQPDPELLSLMDTVGAQIGLFVARRQAEIHAEILLESERAARAEADDAVRLRDEFLASASHDLRGPLTTLRGYAAMARRAIDADDSARAQTSLSNIESSTHRLTATLDELLDLAQLQAGQRLGLHLRMLDLLELVRALAADAQVAAGDKVTINVRSALTELFGAWDASRLERALGNIVNNAVKYSPDRADVVVAVDVERTGSGSWALVRVEDHGVGIPASDLPHIFDRFHRAANVSSKLPGTGLGLPGAREIIRQHGGDITVESQENQGSTFTVRLPLTPPT